MSDESYDPSIYQTSEWVESLRYTQEWNERALYAVMAILGKPSSFLDMGCGDGHLVRIMRRMIEGRANGIELSAESHGTAAIMSRDLRNPFDLSYRFDLVISWEVGEHLPEESADMFCGNLERHVGQWLVFTAAHVGQGGDHHINEQPQEYWREKLEALGLRYEAHETAHLKEAWVWATGPCFWLPANVQVFHREGEQNDQGTGTGDEVDGENGRNVPVSHDTARRNRGGCAGVSRRDSGAPQEPC